MATNTTRRPPLLALSSSLNLFGFPNENHGDNHHHVAIDDLVVAAENAAKDADQDLHEIYAAYGGSHTYTNGARGAYKAAVLLVGALREYREIKRLVDPMGFVSPTWAVQALLEDDDDPTVADVARPRGEHPLDA